MCNKNIMKIAGKITINAIHSPGYGAVNFSTSLRNLIINVSKFHVNKQLT